MNAFLTGSQAYGTPTDESDVDLAIVVSSDDAERLHSLASRRGGSGGGWVSLYFGRLNLVCLAPDEFDAWKMANDQLKAEKPVTKERAIELIDAAKAIAGNDAMDFHVAADLLEEHGFTEQAKLLRERRPTRIEEPAGATIPF
jgi:hypothetical protein